MRGFLKPSERVFFPNPGTLYKEENLFIFFLWIMRCQLPWSNLIIQS